MHERFIATLFAVEKELEWLNSHQVSYGSPIMEKHEAYTTEASPWVLQ